MVLCLGFLNFGRNKLKNGTGTYGLKMVGKEKLDVENLTILLSLKRFLSVLKHGLNQVQHILHPMDTVCTYIIHLYAYLAFSSCESISLKLNFNEFSYIDVSSWGGFCVLQNSILCTCQILHKNTYTHTPYGLELLKPAQLPF